MSANTREKRVRGWVWEGAPGLVVVWVQEINEADQPVRTL